MRHIWLIAIAILAAMPVTQAADCSWSGTWTSSWGEMVLQQSAGGGVTGTYTWDNGNIEGTVSGNVLSGTWTETPTRKGPNDAGAFVFTLSPDCNSFTGKWNYAAEGSEWKEDWTGTRVAPELSCDETCKQKDPNSVWKPVQTDETPKGPNSCSCDCKEGYGKDDSGVCQQCCDASMSRQEGGASNAAYSYDYDTSAGSKCVQCLPKDCNADCKQRDPNSIWKPLYGDENPKGPNLCSCGCPDGYGLDSSLICQPCQSVCNKGDHFTWDKEGSINGECVCGCDEKNGWVDDGFGGCKQKTTDCDAYCSSLAPHKVWDKKSSPPACSCICGNGYHDDGSGSCVKNIPRPDQNIGAASDLKKFLVEKLHYTEGSPSDDWMTAPIGSVLLWGLSSDPAAPMDHSTIVISDYEQIGMKDVPTMNLKDEIPRPNGITYYFRGILYPPDTRSVRTKLLNPLNVEPIVSKYKNIKDRYIPGTTNWAWNCHGFAANIAYDLFGGESVLNP